MTPDYSLIDRVRALAVDFAKHRQHAVEKPIMRYEFFCGYADANKFLRGRALAAEAVLRSYLPSELVHG